MKEELHSHTPNDTSNGLVEPYDQNSRQTECDHEASFSDETEVVSLTEILDLFKITQKTALHRLSDLLPPIMHGSRQIPKAFQLNEVKQRLQRYKNLPQVDSNSDVYVDEEGNEWSSRRTIQLNTDIKYPVLDEIFSEIPFQIVRNKKGQPTKFYRTGDVLEKSHMRESSGENIKRMKRRVKPGDTEEANNYLRGLLNGS